MEGTVRLSDDLTLVIRKLTFTDFMGCDFVPLVFSGVNIDEKPKKDADDSYLKELFDKAIMQVISTEYTREIALDYIYKNAQYKKIVFQWIHALAFKDEKTDPVLISKKMAVNIHNIAMEYGKLPSEIIEDANNKLSNFNLNMAILSAGREEKYRQDMIAALESMDHKCNGRETTDQLERLLQAKRQRKNGRR